LNLRIPQSLHKRLKVLAGLSGVTMTEIIIECLGAEVTRRQDSYDRGE
jgi:predicted HicB family RNase H-like nuclease